MRITKKAISLILAVMMIASLFVAVPMSASAVTQNDISVLLQQMEELAEERDEQGDYDASDALYLSSMLLDHQFRESENYATDPNVERAYNIASAVYNHFNGTGSVDVTSVSRTEVDKLDEALQDLMHDYMMSNDHYNAMVLDCAEDILQEAYHAADGNSEDQNLLSAYSLVSFILAQYTGTTGSYTVTWKNGDTVIETDTGVAEGSTPTYNGTTPEKAEDETNTYTFSGWSDGNTTYGLSDTLPAVSGDVTYTATFTSTEKVPTYTITWRDYDTYDLIDTTQVEEGVVPTHTDPTKADLMYTYTFTGWYPNLVAATQAKTYYAQFAKNRIYYAIGDSIDFGTSTYVYNYADWTKQELSGSYTVVSATYNSEKYCYDIVLQSGDNTVVLGAYGNGGSDNVVLYFRSGEGTSSSPYMFEVVPVGTVIWKDEDGNILETDENVPQGSKPSFDGTYTKESESPEDYYYVTRWFEENYDGSISESPNTLSGLSDVSFTNGQKVYHGKQIKVKYLKPGATFFKLDGIDYNNTYVKLYDDEDASLYSGSQIIRDVSLSYSSGDTYRYRVERSGDNYSNYTYKNYNENLGEKVAWRCTGGDGTQDNPYTFDFIPYADVTWKLDADTVIDTDFLEWGTVPTHADATKADDDTYTYTFTGWTPEIKAVDGDITYTAQFTATEKYVAQITSGGTTTKYESLAEAITAAEDGDTITVLADTDVAYASIANKSITIDATGHTVTGGQYHGMNVPMFVVKSTGGLTLAGGTFTNAGDSVVNNNGTLVVDGATLNGDAFAVYNGGSLTVSSGSVSGNQNSVNNGASNATTTITGGSFTGKLQNTAGEIAVSGGTFDTDVDIYAAPGFVGTQTGATTFSVKVDDNPLGLAPIIGFQKKATGNLSGNDIGTQGVRIVTKVEGCDLTQFEEYGYVVAKVIGKEQATANFNNMKAYGGNGEKTIKCNGTVNTIDGYGTPYVTLAVNGMNDGDQVAARFYAIKDGVTYYSNYVSTARYNGIIATY